MDEDDDEDEEPDSESEAEVLRNSGPTATPDPSGIVAATTAEPSELMQLEMSEDIRVGSPDDGSNNFDSDFQLLAVTSSQSRKPDQQRKADSYRAESTRRWASVQEPMVGVQLPASESGKEAVSK